MHVLLLLLQRKAAKDLGHKLAANCTPHRLRQQFGRVLLQLNQQHYFKISRYACSAAVVAALLLLSMLLACTLLLLLLLSVAQ